MASRTSGATAKVEAWHRNRMHPAYRLMRPKADADGWLILRFDGACEGNGQPDATGGYGWTLIDSDGMLLSQGSGKASGAPITNNTAEWQGLAFGLDGARDYLLPRFPDAAKLKLLIEGDSDLVVKCLSGEWRCRDRRLATCRDTCLDLLAEMKLPWRIRWIPREQNGECDDLSKMTR